MHGTAAATGSLEVPQETRGQAVIELVGPAAAGKTSLLKVLQAQDGSFRTGRRASVYRHLAGGLTLLPTFLALHRPCRGIWWKEMKRITYVTTLARHVRDTRTASGDTVVFDEGAIYMLARLRVFGGAALRSPAFERWWRGAIEGWAALLDLIVIVDAPDPVLMHRLRTRAQAHPVKGLSDRAIREFTASYRASYDRVLGELCASRPVRILTLSTDSVSPGQAAERIVTELRLRGQRGSQRH